MVKFPTLVVRGSNEWWRLQAVAGTAPVWGAQGSRFEVIPESGKDHPQIYIFTIANITEANQKHETKKKQPGIIKPKSWKRKLLNSAIIFNKK